MYSSDGRDLSADTAMQHLLAFAARLLCGAVSISPIVDGEGGQIAAERLPLCLDGVAVASLCCVRMAEHEPDERWKQDFAALARLCEAHLQQQQRFLLARQQHQAVLDNAADAIIVIDQSGIIQSANHACERLFGYALSELMGSNVNILMGGAERAAHDGYLARYLQTTHASIIGIGREVRVRHKHGHSLPARLSIGESVIGGQRLFTGILHDLTAHKAVQLELENQRLKLDTLLNASPNPIVGKDLNGRYTFANAVASTMLGIDHQSVQGKTDHELFPPELADRIVALDKQVMGSGEPCAELIHYYRDARAGQPAREQWINMSKAPWRDANGQITGLVAVGHDVSEQQRSEQKAQAARQQLLTAIENIPDGFALYGEDDCLLLCNRRYQALYPLIADQMQAGTPFADILRAGVARGQFSDAIAHEEEWLAWRLAQKQQSQSSFIYPLDGGRWLKVANCRVSGLGWLSVQTDITELKAAQEAALSASRAKDEFLSSMSHELRTPMNAILGFAQLMENSQRDPLTDKQKKQVGHIRQAGSHLLGLINEVLDLASIESGKLTLSLENVQLNELAEETLALASSLIGNRNIIFHQQGSKHLMVRADRMRLRQVLLNLLGNAIKYHHASGGHIAVHIGWSPASVQMVRIVVEDDGPGIPEDKLHLLFQPFQRLGQEQGHIEGTGVGLAICKRLLQHMQGSIGVDPVATGGTRFWFDLPGVDPVDVAAGKAGESKGALPAVQNGQKTVLYIEDNPQNCQLMQDIMEEYPAWQLVLAPDAQSGLALAIRDQPDLILMDLNLPGMDGFAARQALRAHEETRTIPVIALSANAMEHSVRRAHRAGFADYLTKPVDLAALNKVLQCWLNPLTETPASWTV
ncbi:PAS domain S-box protein [Aquitalea sp. S1-19]|nr:PAS domain S-box protein [Aquitalea sp. S1-19]